MILRGTLEQTEKALEEILEAEGAKDKHTINGVEIWKDENTIEFEDKTRIELGYPDTDTDGEDIKFVNHEVTGPRHIKVFRKHFEG